MNYEKKKKKGEKEEEKAIFYSVFICSLSFVF